MTRTIWTALVVLLLLASVAQGGQATRDHSAIDASHSKITIRVFKTGLFSPLAHNHEIDAPIDSGEVSQSGNASVELRVAAGKLRVLDPEASVSTRADIQKTMLGPEVLDADRFPEIHFQSTSVESKGTDAWTVHGNLDLHGQVHPVTVDVSLKDGVFRGSATLKQTEFGITPVKVAGGTVKVKDELKVEFEIALAK